MSTSAQIEANRRNAQLSTGPTTDEGKSVSSQNACTHGLASEEFVVGPGEEETLDTFLESLSAELKPVGPLEFDLFLEAAHASWTMLRCRRAEVTLAHDGAGDPLLDEKKEARFRRIEFYLRRAERSYHRTLKELRAVQTERAYRREVDPPSQQNEPTIHDDSPLMTFQTVLPKVRRTPKRTPFRFEVPAHESALIDETIAKVIAKKKTA